MVRRIVISISRLDCDEERYFTFLWHSRYKTVSVSICETSKVSKREKWLLQIEEKARAL